MEIYTDGSHSLKPRMSGVGAVILNNGKEHQIGGYTDRCADNNVAEVIAIAYAIKYIKDIKLLIIQKIKILSFIQILLMHYEKYINYHLVKMNLNNKH